MKTVPIMALMIWFLFWATMFAKDYEGWEVIKAELVDDGKGDEFVVHDIYAVSPPFTGSEFEKVMRATEWVHNHITYTSEFTETWTPSDQLYDEIGMYGLGKATGDCEEYAILLCAFIRFNIGVDENRVWVAVGCGLLGLHAWVEYVDEGGIHWMLDPTWDMMKSENPRWVKFKFNDQWFHLLSDMGKTGQTI